MKRILCYGDSNTWGFIPGTDHQRFNENERYTRLLSSMLGSEYEVIEEGLNSRTFFSVDKRPGKEGRVGYDYLKPCIESHDKFDIMVLMLGTNELKKAYNNTPQQILEMLKVFINTIQSFKSQIDGSTPTLIISGIPLVTERLPEDEKYAGAEEKSKILCELYRDYCKENGILFVDNTDLETGADGIHLTAASHKLLAQRLCKLVIQLPIK